MRERRALATFGGPARPTRGTKVPAGPDWIHEIKHDSYRLIVQLDGKRVQLLTPNGYDWADRYPLIVEAALRNRTTSFVIDGEGLEGLISKHKDRPDRGGRQPHSIKVKNRSHPAMQRVQELLS